jgi:hypothetical protein
VGNDDGKLQFDARRTRSSCRINSHFLDGEVLSVSATAKRWAANAEAARTTNSPSSPLLHSGLGSAGYIVVSAGLTIIRETLSSCPATLSPVSVEEANMIGIRAAFAVALVAPFLGALLSAEAAKGDQRAARAECFRQAQAAVNAIGFSPTTADKNAVGMDAYRQCCFKAGIRP